MHRLLLRPLLLVAPVVIVSLLIGWPDDRIASAEAVARVNCRAPHQREANLAPVGAGPLALAAVYCQTGRSGPSHSARSLLVSPDGRSLALSNPYPGEQHSRMVLSPDGSRVLIGRLHRTAAASASSRAAVSQGPRSMAFSQRSTTSRPPARCGASARLLSTITSSPCPRSVRMGGMPLSD